MSTQPPQLRPAQSRSVGERLAEMLFGVNSADAYYKRRLSDLAETLKAHQAWQQAGGPQNPAAPLPGGNPEAASPFEAAMGLGMSMGGGQALPAGIFRQQLYSMKEPVPARLRPGISLEQNMALGETRAPESKGDPLVDTLLSYASRKTARMREEAKQKAGGFANTSKLECAAWGIPASLCGVGGRLRKVEGSVCHDCYAQGTTGSGKFKLSMYGQENVKKANLNRFETFDKDPKAWAENMSVALLDAPRFRWFDSGDLQGTRMLDAIVEVAKKTPWTSHWLPTKERPVVDKWLKDHPEGFPANLQVRISLPLKEQLPENYKRSAQFPSAQLPVAGVTSDPKKATCPAGTQGGMCAPKGKAPCRNCFTNQDVVYLQH